MLILHSLLYYNAHGEGMQNQRSKRQAAKLESKTADEDAVAAAQEEEEYDEEEEEEEEALMCHMMKCSQVKKCHLSYEFIVCT